MTRNLKALGLALLALAAMGALAAQGASAATHTFTSSANTTVLTGNQEKGTVDVFSLPKNGGGLIETKCTQTTFSGTQTGSPVAFVTVHPKYSECKLGPVNAVVNTNGCNYKFTGQTTTSTHLTGEHATVDIECEAGHSITVSGGGCVLTMGPQEGLHGVTYKNITTLVTHPSGTVDNNVKARTFTLTLKTISVKAVGANCALVGLTNGMTYTTGEYKGVTEVGGYVDNGTVSGNTTEGFVFNDGALVDIGFITD